MPSRVAALALVCVVLGAVGTPTECYLRNPLDPNLDWYKPYDLMTFNATTDDYVKLLRDMNTIFVQDANNLIFDSTWVLPQQNLNNKPFKWLILEVLGDGDNKAMLAIRRDNLYVTGFTDRDGNWYIFSNRPRWLILVATVFRLADDYPSLVGGYTRLRGVRVSKQTTVEAIERLANFAPRESADVGYVSRALAIMAITFAEASRFYPIGDLINHQWESSADLGTVADLVVKWRVISCALLISMQEKGSWDSDEAWDLSNNNNIHTIDDALDALAVALWPAQGRCSKLIKWLK